MRKIIYLIAVCITAASMAGCMGKKESDKVELADTVMTTVPDTALYGVISDATSMHNLVVVTDEGKSVECAIDLDTLSNVQGGLFAGDRITLTTTKTDEGLVVQKSLNLTTLLGRWTSLDKNFEIKENGVVESSVKTESNPYTQWTTVNANLVLNRDTFQVLLLGPDSLSLENGNGIFVYKRQR